MWNLSAGITSSPPGERRLESRAVNSPSRSEVSQCPEKVLGVTTVSRHETLWYVLFLRTFHCESTSTEVFSTSRHFLRALWKPRWQLYGERIPGGEKCFPNSPAWVSPRLGPAVRRVWLTPDIYKWHALIDPCHQNNISTTTADMFIICPDTAPVLAVADSRVWSSSTAVSMKIHL